MNMPEATPPDGPPRLVVAEEAWEDVRPTAAILRVALTADRFFSDRAVLEKAEELRRLVAALNARGIPAEAVSLEGATLDVSSGLFTRSSSVTYRVRILVKDVERVVDVIDAVAESKRATLTGVEWDYRSASRAPSPMLGECAARALAKARALAAALSVEVVRIRTVREEELSDHGPVSSRLPYGGPQPGALRSRSSVASELGGLELAPTKKIGVRVHLECDLAEGPNRAAEAPGA